MSYEIRSQNTTDGQDWHKDYVPQKHLIDDDFAGINFYSSNLTEKFRDLKASKLFEIETIDDVAEVGYQGRTVSMYFDITNKPKRNSQKTIWHHKTRGPHAVQKMSVNSTISIVTKPGKIAQNAALRYNRKKGNLLLPERLRLNLSNIVAIRSNVKVLGGPAWTPIFLKDNYAKLHNVTDDTWSKAMAVWFNSTLGIFSVCGLSIMFNLNYPKFAEFNKFIIPKLNTKQINNLAKIFDANSHLVFQKFSTKMDATREVIDRLLSKTLNVDYGIISQIHDELVKEPMLTEKQYNNGSLDLWT